MLRDLLGRHGYAALPFLLSLAFVPRVVYRTSADGARSVAVIIAPITRTFKENLPIAMGLWALEILLGAIISCIILWLVRPRST